MDKRKYFATDRRGTIGIVFAFIFPGHDHVHGGMVDVGMAIAARFELAYVTKVACTRLATARSNGMSTSDQLKAANAAVAAHLPETLLNPQVTKIDSATSGGSARATEGRRARWAIGHEHSFRDVLGLSNVRAELHSCVNTGLSISRAWDWSPNDNGPGLSDSETVQKVQ